MVNLLGHGLNIIVLMLINARLTIKCQRYKNINKQRQQQQKQQQNQQEWQTAFHQENIEFNDEMTNDPRRTYNLLLFPLWVFSSEFGRMFLLFCYSSFDFFVYFISNRIIDELLLFLLYCFYLVTFSFFFLTLHEWPINQSRLAYVWLLRNETLPTRGSTNETKWSICHVFNIRCLKW